MRARYARDMRDLTPVLAKIRADEERPKLVDYTVRYATHHKMRGGELVAIFREEIFETDENAWARVVGLAPMAWRAPITLVTPDNKVYKLDRLM